MTCHDPDEQRVSCYSVILLAMIPLSRPHEFLEVDSHRLRQYVYTTAQPLVLSRACLLLFTWTLNFPSRAAVLDATSASWRCPVSLRAT
jgi:hypothetical protein